MLITNIITAKAYGYCNSFSSDDLFSCSLSNLSDCCCDDESGDCVFMSGDSCDSDDDLSSVDDDLIVPDDEIIEVFDSQRLNEN
jgi:hypothetical protein